jgi:hypothetical protein
MHAHGWLEFKQVSLYAPKFMRWSTSIITTRNHFSRLRIACEPCSAGVLQRCFRFLHMVGTIKPETNNQNAPSSLIVFVK